MVVGRLRLVLCILVSCAVLGQTPALANSKYAAVVIHADTGDVLFDRYSTQRRYPASLTKMMTVYMLFEELEAGNLTLQTKMKVSRNAARMPASKLGLKTGSTITVEKAIEALIIKSANDVAVVVAEHLGKSEASFARQMTARARRMGMRSTQFRNASGLHNSKQFSTARDLAVLSQRVVQDFPQYWHYFQKSSFEWNGRTYRSHNKLVGKFEGADGLKTGYTRKSGYNLATTIERGDNRLIGIVLGGRSGATRDRHMREILNKAEADIIVNPELISAVHRVKPMPSMKPTRLAELGGQWPPASAALASASDVGTAPALEGSSAFQLELAARAASFTRTDESGLPTADNMQALIAQSEADRLNRQELQTVSLNDSMIGEGDIDPEFIPAELAWSIQTGAYRDRSYAELEMADDLALIQPVAPQVLDRIIEAESAGHPLFRVRFIRLSQEQADRACGVIIADGGECFAMRDRDLTDN